MIWNEAVGNTTRNLGQDDGSTETESNAEHSEDERCMLTIGPWYSISRCKLTMSLALVSGESRQTDDRLSEPSTVKFGRQTFESVMRKRKSITQSFLRRQRNNDVYKSKNTDEGFVPCSLSTVPVACCNIRKPTPPWNDRQAYTSACEFARNYYTAFVSDFYSVFKCLIQRNTVLS